MAFISSKQRCAPTDSCSSEPIAPSAMRMECFRRSLKSWIFKSVASCLRDTRAGTGCSAFLFHEAGDRAHQVVLGENLEARAAHFDENRWILVAQNVRDTLDRGAARDLRQRFAHHFAHHQLAEIFALQREVQDLIFVNRADRKIFLEDRNLRDVLLLHGLQRVEDGLVGTRDDQFADFPGVMFRADHFASGNLHGGVNVSALAHPLVVIDLAEIAHAGVGQECDDKRFGSQIFREAQRGGNAAAAGASGEQALHLHQAAGDDEALVVIDLHDVVENLQVHGRREKIFADALDHVSLGFHLFATLYVIVVKRADGIDADNLHLGIFFLEKFAGAADGAAGAHAANEMRDFSFGVVPDFRAGGEVVGLRVHRIVVLIWVEGVGYFARELFRHRIVAARIFGLDRRGTHDDFGAEGLQEVDFFLGLLVGDGENHLVAAHGGDQRQPHAGVSRSAFDDRAARLQQAFSFGVVDHGDADAVLYGAAGVDVVRFDVDLRLQTLVDAVEAHQRRAADGIEDVVTFHLEFSG